MQKKNNDWIWQVEMWLPEFVFRTTVLKLWPNLALSTLPAQPYERKNCECVTLNCNKDFHEIRFLIVSNVISHLGCLSHYTVWSFGTVKKWTLITQLWNLSRGFPTAQNDRNFGTFWYLRHLGPSGLLENVSTFISPPWKLVGIE